MSNKDPLGDKLFFYLLFWFISIMFVAATAISDPHETGLVLLVTFAPQLMTAFIMGAVALFVLNFFRHASEALRWGMVLLSSGAILLFFYLLPDLLNAYIYVLVSEPYTTIACSSGALGVLLILWDFRKLLNEAIRSQTGILIANIKLQQEARRQQRQQHIEERKHYGTDDFLLRSKRKKKEEVDNRIWIACMIVIVCAFLQMYLYLDRVGLFEPGWGPPVP